MRKMLVIFVTLCVTLSFASCSSSTAIPSASTNNSQNLSESAPAESAQNVKWPTGDITVVVAASSGGGTDIQARIIAEYFNKYTGHNLIIENQSSGSGTVAYEQVRNAKPDGKTLLYYHSSMYISYYSGIYQHNILENFSPIAKITESYGNAICVPGNSPYTTLDELVTAAKKSPNTIIAGIQIGGFPEYLIKLLEKDGECTFKNVDAGNASDRLTSLLGGHIDVACINAANAVQYEPGGELKILGICAKERVDAYPNWPSTTELGYPSVIIPNGQFFYAPIGTDPSLAQSMNDVFTKIGADPEFQAATLNNGVMPDVKNYEGTINAAHEADQNIKNILSLVQ